MGHIKSACEDDKEKHLTIWIMGVLSALHVGIILHNNIVPLSSASPLAHKNCDSNLSDFLLAECSHADRTL
jgi:hypothetical protein